MSDFVETTEDLIDAINSFCIYGGESRKAYEEKVTKSGDRIRFVHEVFQLGTKDNTRDYLVSEMWYSLKKYIDDFEETPTVFWRSYPKFIQYCHEDQVVTALTMRLSIGAERPYEFRLRKEEGAEGVID